MSHPSGQPPACKLSEKISAGLYLVATPIGNLGDISHRALETLEEAAVVLCEDTRVSRKLAQHYGIKTPLVSCHEHNQMERLPLVLDTIRQGGAVALISDAGMPLISDPGAPLVLAVQEAGLKVTSVPGANAVLAALSLSGLSSTRFLFAGFLPTKSGARRDELVALANVPATLVFYESPNRVGEALADMHKVLGNRSAALVREITKLHEEVVRAPLADLAARYQDAAVRGEVVLVIAPPAQQREALDLDALLKAELQRGSLKDAVAVATARTGLPRREVYARAVALEQGKA